MQEQERAILLAPRRPTVGMKRSCTPLDSQDIRQECIHPRESVIITPRVPEDVGDHKTAQLPRRLGMMPPNRCRPDSEFRRDPFVGPAMPISAPHDGLLLFRQPRQRTPELGADLVQPRGMSLVFARCRRTCSLIPRDFPALDPHPLGAHSPQVMHEDIPGLRSRAKGSFLIHRERPHIRDHFVGVEGRGPPDVRANARIVPAYELTPPRFACLRGVHQRIGPESTLLVRRRSSLSLSLSLSPPAPRTPRLVFRIRPPAGGIRSVQAGSRPNGARRPGQYASTGSAPPSRHVHSRYTRLPGDELPVTTRRGSAKSGLLSTCRARRARPVARQRHAAASPVGPPVYGAKTVTP